jgi:DMSO/TMAO reductase YedYZ heme-binding membrane subunit
MTKIYGVAIAGAVIIVAFLALTSIGHVIDLATQHFMLFYAGVFVLIALCASVGLGLVATDRMILNPGHRVFVQSMHRAASFGALAFLVIHIVTEILAQRAHVIDAFVPFLSPFRTFYIGLGTISSDLILLLVITSIFRKRFTTNSKAWQWRAIHYSAYVSFVFGVWHGLLGGRPGKPYVDWSYGFVIAFVALGLAVRALANSLRPKENLSSPAVDERSTGSAPLRAASLGMAAQFGGSRMQALRGADRITGAQPALSATATVLPGGTGSGPMPALAALPSGGAETARQPFYEPGYEGPPRYVGASRPLAADPPPPAMPIAAPRALPRAATGPMPRAATGPMPRVESGRQPRPATGPMPRPATGPVPRAATGPMPRAATGPMPRAATGPMPQTGGQQARPARGNPGPAPRNTGAMPRANTGAVPRAGTGPVPRTGTGPTPRPATGPMPQANGGPQGPRPRPANGQAPGTAPKRGGAHRGRGAAPRNSAPSRGPSQGPPPGPPQDSWPPEADDYGSNPYPTRREDDWR